MLRNAIGAAVAALVLAVAAGRHGVAALGPDPSDYNVQWLSVTPEPGTNEGGQPTYAGTMPLGNGDLVAQVWANASAGGVQFFVTKSDALASDTTPMKMAMVQVLISPNPFAAGAYFNQTLTLATGAVTAYVGGTSYASYAAAVTVWVDANSDAVYVQASGGAAPGFATIGITVNTMSTRPNDTFTYDLPFSCAGKGTSSPDVYVDPLPAMWPVAGSLVQYHRNDYTVDGDYFNWTLSQQGLGPLVSTLRSTSDWWQDRQFGVAVDGYPALTRTSPSSLTSSSPAATFIVRVTGLSQQTASAAMWLGNLATMLTPLSPSSVSAAWTAHTAWWSSFWFRSHIDVAASAPDGYNISRAYALTRFVQAVQSRNTLWPIKFNGASSVRLRHCSSGAIALCGWGRRR